MRVENGTLYSEGTEVVAVPVRGDIADLLEQSFLAHTFHSWGVGVWGSLMSELVASENRL